MEMASLATIADLLGGSGWTHALPQANIATPGTGVILETTHHADETCTPSYNQCIVNTVAHGL